VKVEDARRMAAAAKKAEMQTPAAFKNVETPAVLVAKPIIERAKKQTFAQKIAKVWETKSWNV
jgi:hypothetical protein